MTNGQVQHCLHILSEEFSNLLAYRESGKTNPSGHGGHGGSKGGTMVEHILHCFEYIKMSLTCAADTTLEGQKKDLQGPGTDGFGAVHQCRNFDDVFNWAEMHRASDQTGYPH